MNKLALIKWMDSIYACRNYNYSDILHKTTLDRKMLRQIQKKVNGMKKAGSTKSGGFANKTRKLLSLSQFPVVDEA